MTRIRERRTARIILSMLQRMPVLLSCVLLAPVLIAQTSTPAKLVSRAETGTAMLDDLRELCDTIGGRPTGSQSCNRAVAWAAQKFRDAGVPKVTVESYTIPHLWLPGTASAEAISPAHFPIRIASAPMSPATKGALEAKVVDVGDGSAEAFAKVGDRARGGMVLVRSSEMKTLDDLFAEYIRNAAITDAAVKYGAVAILLESSRPRGLLYRHPISLSTEYAPLPSAIVSREHAERLARLAEKGEVRVRLNMAPELGGAYTSSNVIAEIPGREKPNEIVLLGAHLDSWDLGTGAEDNGVNAAMVIDAARSFVALGARPRRTVRFALFTGEEQGMLGSQAYVSRHRAELGNHVAAIAYDMGSGHTSGFFLNGREDLRAPVNAALDQAGGLGATEQVIDAIDGTDNFDFMISGVPNLVAVQDAAAYLPDYHAESDTFDRVNAKEARHNEAIASVLVWGLADAPNRPAPRQSRAEVEKLLVDTKMVEQMKTFAQWNDFQAHRRGFDQ